MLPDVLGYNLSLNTQLKASVYIHTCISQSLLDYEYSNKSVSHPTYKIFCLLVQTNSLEWHKRNTSLITQKTPMETHGWYRETSPEVCIQTDSKITAR